jgi:hypothetical protein
LAETRFQEYSRWDILYLDITHDLPHDISIEQQLRSLDSAQSVEFGPKMSGDRNREIVLPCLVLSGTQKDTFNWLP